MNVMEALPVNCEKWDDVNNDIITESGWILRVIRYFLE